MVRFISGLNVRHSSNTRQCTLTARAHDRMAGRPCRMPLGLSYWRAVGSSRCASPRTPARPQHTHRCSQTPFASSENIHHIQACCTCTSSPTPSHRHQVQLLGGICHPYLLHGTLWQHVRIMRNRPAVDVALILSFICHICRARAAGVGFSLPEFRR